MLGTQHTTRNPNTDMFEVRILIYAIPSNQSNMMAFESFRYAYGEKNCAAKSYEKKHWNWIHAASNISKRTPAFSISNNNRQLTNCFASLAFGNEMIFCRSIHRNIDLIIVFIHSFITHIEWIWCLIYWFIYMRERRKSHWHASVAEPFFFSLLLPRPFCVSSTIAFDLLQPIIRVVFFFMNEAIINIGGIWVSRFVGIIFLNHGFWSCTVVGVVANRSKSLHINCHVKTNRC